MNTEREHAMDNISSDLSDELTAGIDAAVDGIAAEQPAFVAKELYDKAVLYQERNAIYGDNYKRFGPVMSLVLTGQTLNPMDAAQMNRLGILVQIVAKITRYGENFTKGGHDDSLDDIAVYSMMLKELDRGL